MFLVENRQLDEVNFPV